jgi:hypothetical protein
MTSFAPPIAVGSSARAAIALARHPRGLRAAEPGLESFPEAASLGSGGPDLSELAAFEHPASACPRVRLDALIGLVGEWYHRYGAVEVRDVDGTDSGVDGDRARVITDGQLARSVSAAGGV